MFLINYAIFLLFIHATLTLGWPATNYSKSASTYGIGALDDEVDWSQHPCKRECKDNMPPMTCRYGFTIENYATMSRACYDCPYIKEDCFRPHCLPGDGNIKMVLVVNRLLPGPSIEVCKGDRIIVDVTNMLNSETTTLHWHGMDQRGTPFMDGVPMISQCPIAAGDSFRYDFKAENAGTHWWHAHSGLQRSDGIFGALIVRKPALENLVGQLYDHDHHLIILNEWRQFIGSEAYTLLHHTEKRVSEPTTIMINGLGRYENRTQSALIPQPIFSLEKNKRHRFRVIGASSIECSFTLSVDNHSLLVISSDGSDVEPIEVDAIRLDSGERYDFVLNSNREIDNYWMHIIGDLNCRGKRQEAILRYKGAPDLKPNGPTGRNVAMDSGKRLLNPLHQGSETKGAMCISCSLTSIEPNDNDELDPNPDFKFYLNIDFYLLNHPNFHRKNLYDIDQVDGIKFSWQINHLSFKMPSFPLQTQPELIEADQLCNVTEAQCTREQCSCPYVLQVKLNSTVEFILVSEASIFGAGLTDGMLPHPMHLHGFSYRVLAMEQMNGSTTTVEEIRALDQAGKIHRKLKGAPWKDVISPPHGGYVIVRFLADNPGYWYFHCHYDRHMQNGMAMVLKVGEHEDFPVAPKDFLKCNYRNHDIISHKNNACAATQVEWTLIVGISIILYPFFTSGCQNID